MTFSWLTLSSAISAIQARLNDPGVFWTQAELQGYLLEALRLYNALTGQWRADFVLSSGTYAWTNTGTVAGSPRLRSVTDADLYTQIQYMLLEPPTGAGTWTGTSQFSLSKLQTALSNRRNEMIQETACNLSNLAPITTVPNTRRTLLADTVLEPRRIRFLGVLANTTGTAASGSQTLVLASAQGVAAGQVVSGAGIVSGTFVTGLTGTTASISLPTSSTLSATPLQFWQPMTLTREDTQTFQYFAPSFIQTSQFPQSWSVASEPPLAFDVDTPPNVPGAYDVIALQSGPIFAPPAATLLGVPDDWSMIPMYGSLASLLSAEPEATDRVRSAYCAKRFEDGLKMMQVSNWFIQATIDGVPCDTPSLYERDVYATEWQTQDTAYPCVVQAGIDFVYPVPVSTDTGVSLTLVQNAPLLDATSTYVQVSRDAWSAILDYTQHIACFKLGGAEFMATMPLLDGFFRWCKSVNSRLETYGLYTDILSSQGRRQEEEVPR